MINKWLCVALCCAASCCGALSPLAAPAPADDSDCALLLAGPPRSSAYDYTINLLKGNFAYDGQQSCITYEAVNQAYLEARHRIVVSQPKGDWKPEDYASVGELVLDISINLARRYGLTYEEIEKGLPLIDTSRTLIREVCPPVFSHVECRAGKYRRLDGLCNNLRHPTWGSTNAPFQRLLSPLFSDGINSPRIAHSGRELPLSRVVSRTMHPDDGFHDHAGTVMVIAWGQFMDHDYTLTGTPLDPRNRNDPEECCKRPPHLKHPYCNEIRIPDDDYFYRLFGVKCIDFVRGFPSPRPGCRLGSRVPFNTLTGVIDGNTVYGVTEKFARKLRTGYGGLLRMNPVFQEYGLKDLLPLKLDIPDEGCTRPNNNMYCFEAGEIRVNEQLVLTVMHTLMAREHNRVATALAAVNPHWDDETLYQEARRINIAEIQHITYNEFLPILLGKDVMEKFGLVLEKEGYWDGYDSEVNPDVLASFAAAAYRFGHSLLPTAVERWSKAHKFIASKRLSDLIRRPYDLYRAGVLDEYVMGLMNQVAQAMDDSITQEVTNHLFKKVGARFGMDLVSFNMQRGREFGLPGYMEFRKFCGLPGADSFADLFGSMSNHTVRKYETIFEHPVDVDLWSGGVSERPLPGSMLGPTFACIIATQFSYSRRGDRFWFELPHQPSSFSPAQLAELRKARLARVICDNTDIIDTVQLYPMVLPDHELNPRVPCRSGIIPSMDFSKWAEPAPFAAPAKDFITFAFVSSNITGDGEQTEPINNVDGENSKESQQLPTETSKIACNTVDCRQTPSDHNNHTTTPLNNVTLSQDGQQIDSHTESNNTVDRIANDKILTYLHKNNGSTVKSRGHYKNSLRKKRSADVVSGETKKLPLIVDYETTHPVDTERDRETWLPARNTALIVNPADLAHFNIETLHERGADVTKPRDNEPIRTPENSEEGKSDEDSATDKKYDDSKEIVTDVKENKNNPESFVRNKKDKQNQKSVKKLSEERDDSSEVVTERTTPLQSEETDEHSGERDEYSGERNVHSGERDKNSGERDDSREVREKRPAQETSVESDEHSEETLANLKKDTTPHFGNDNTQYKPRTDDQSPTKLQDVELGDFSYEKIQVNKDGEVIVADDNPEPDDISSSVEFIPSTKQQPLVDNKFDKLNPQSRQNSDTSNSQDSDFVGELRNSELTHIDDGEVKPVIEINAESSSGETSEENSNEHQNKHDRDESGEITDQHITNDRLQENVGDQKKGDVKQQFERIPTDYKHDDNKQESKSNDDTLQEILPTTSPPVNYNDNLNIKFDDISIKLPEIKLPEDILSYTYEDPPIFKLKDDTKKRFYHYSDEVKDEPTVDKLKDDTYNKIYRYTDRSKNPRNREKQPVYDLYKDEVDDHYNDGYYGYDAEHPTKQNYKQKPKRPQPDEDEEEDLYEKFVKERFGKSVNLKKRAKKLHDSRVYDPQLYRQVKNILRKTEEVEKQADKSGDPNAAYTWTLEYGEKL